MNTIKRIIPMLVACLFSVGVVAAEGAGGFFFGTAQPSWNPRFMPEVSMPYDLEFMGAYGYGVTRDGFIIGGFGLAFLDVGLVTYPYNPVQVHLAGGAGGLIVGSRIVGDDHFHLDLAARLGLGGSGGSIESFYTDSGGEHRYVTWHGYALAYAEPYIEVGVGLVPWMHLSAVLSYPVFGNFIPGKPFTDINLHAPALGISATFGAFRRPVPDILE